MGEHDDIIENLGKFYDRQIDRIAQQLRDLADKVETRRVTDPIGMRGYGYQATQVIHDIQWGVANLPLDTLLSAAHDVHHYVTLDSAARGAEVPRQE